MSLVTNNTYTLDYTSNIRFDKINKADCSGKDPYLINCAFISGHEDGSAAKSYINLSSFIIAEQKLYISFENNFCYKNTSFIPKLIVQAFT